MCNTHLPWSNTSHVSDHCHRRSPHPHATRSPCQGETGPPCTRSLAAGSVGKTPPYQLQQEVDKKNLICCSRHMNPTRFKRFGKKHEVERTQKSYIWQVEFLAAGKTIFWPTPHSKETTIDTCGFSAVGTLICVYRNLPNLRRGRRRSLPKPRFKPTNCK